MAPAFGRDVVDAAAREKEVTLTTYGPRSRNTAIRWIRRSRTSRWHQASRRPSGCCQPTG